MKGGYKCNLKRGIQILEKNGGEGAEDIMGTCLQLHISYHLKFLPEKVALVAFKQPCKDSYANQYYCSW